MEKMIGNFKEDGRLPEGFLASLEKLQVVAMCGVSGSGKTYLSKLLEIFGFKRISSDEIIWEFGMGTHSRICRIIKNGDFPIILEDSYRKPLQEP